MKPTDAPPQTASVAETRARAAVRRDVVEIDEADKKAFYAAQEASLADLRAYFANRPRRKG